jgi:hypothetical protein
VERRRRSGSDGGSSSGWTEEETDGLGWEVRPSGLLVQRRGEGFFAGAAPPPHPPPMIRVRVSYGAARHEISVSSIATFGKRLINASDYAFSKSITISEGISWILLLVSD